jgi:hypothetical protein
MVSTACKAGKHDMDCGNYIRYIMTEIFNGAHTFGNLEEQNGSIIKRNTGEDLAQ